MRRALIDRQTRETQITVRLDLDGRGRYEITTGIRRLSTLRDEELGTEAKNLGASLDVVRRVAREGKLPVPNFSAGGIASPADAALMMQLGAEAVFVGSGIFKAEDPARQARAIVKATTHFKDPAELAKISEDVGEAMPGLEMAGLETRLAERGW